MQKNHIEAIKNDDLPSIPAEPGSAEGSALPNFEVELEALLRRWKIPADVHASIVKAGRAALRSARRTVGE